MGLTSSKLFGTDGIRANVQDPIFHPTSLLKLATSTANVLCGDHNRVVLGGDTRRSYDMIANSLSAGLLSQGLDIIHLGTAPTPAISYLTRFHQADFGIVISASHNPAQDNGIKFFSHQGEKLPESAEQRIEALWARGQEHLPSGLLGRSQRPTAPLAPYKEHLLHLYAHLRLKGLVIALDCAHGALSYLAPEVFEALGAQVELIGHQPNGQNINEGVGATVPETIQELVRQKKADIGFSFDGDGDRLIAVTNQGELLDGDQILALVADSWKKQERLFSPIIVGTVMANRRLKFYLEERGLTLIKAPVGDRWVAEKMTEKDAQIGGEASGHVIFKPLTTTGDGLLAALELLSVQQYADQSLTPAFTVSPQVLKSVHVVNKTILASESWQAFYQDFEAKWGKECEVLIRPSGTEPVIRVMLQGDDSSLIHALCHELCAYLEHLST